MNKKNENNRNEAYLVGKITNLRKVWTSSQHTTYEGTLEIIRDSGTIDLLPILFNDYEIQSDTYVQVIGQFRSRDILDETGKLKVELYIYAKEIQNICSNNDSIKYENTIFITGYICKRPTIRTTPSGKQVCDLLIACNFGKDKTAYIPAVSWGRYARKSGKYLVGTEVIINGRLQSRKYNKLINDTINVEKLAYELSISTIEDICSSNSQGVVEEV